MPNRPIFMDVPFFGDEGQRNGRYGSGAVIDRRDLGSR